MRNDRFDNFNSERDIPDRQRGQLSAVALGLVVGEVQANG